MDTVSMTNYSNVSKAGTVVCYNLTTDDSQKLSEIFILLCAPVTIFLNVLVLIVAAKFVNYKKRIEQWFVINMTCADLLFGLSYMTTANVTQDVYANLCRPYYALVWTSSICSIIFLLLLNVHKMITLLFPIKSLSWLSKSRAFMQIFAVWLTVLTFSTAFTFEPIFRLETTCPSCYVFIEPFYYCLRLILFYIAPLSLSLVISVAIFTVAQRKSHLTKSKLTLKRVIFVFTSTVWTALTVLPYRIYYLREQMCIAKINSEEAEGDSFVSHKKFNVYANSSEFETHQQHVSCKGNINVSYLLLCWLTVGSALNPLITIIIQERYRKGVRCLWRKLLGKPDDPSSAEKILELLIQNRRRSRQCLVSKFVSND